MLHLSKVLVVGATGATGKHVVQMLLDKNLSVKVICRSKEKLMGLLLLKEDQDYYGDRLSVTEAPVLDLTDAQLKEHTQDCQAVVSCLGHTMDLWGIWGAPRDLVTQATRRLTTNMPVSCKYILMSGSAEGVSHPDGTTDPQRPLMERAVLTMVRYMIPPHADMESAVAYLYDAPRHRQDIEWCVVRPADLIDNDNDNNNNNAQVSEYEISESQTGPLFGDKKATRANIAHFMVELVTSQEKWSFYNHKMPIICDKQQNPAPTTEMQEGTK
jgi:nucleoside-diphosphate-sugar epimerase